MAPSTNFSIRHEYAKVRSPRRITSNGWDRSELLMKKPGDECNAEGEEVEFLMKRSSTGIIHSRICANCRTSKTPLWRSGPTGPKSLCNACGIRFRKKQQEAGSNKDTLSLLSLSGVVTSPGGDSASENVLTLEEMKAQQKAKQERHLRFVAKRLVQERRRRQLEMSRREIVQAAQLLVSLSNGATPSS